jgi:hypothetical protein
MTKEQKFYNALKDIFVGAKVEGESGYIISASQIEQKFCNWWVDLKNLDYKLIKPLMWW